MLPHDFILFLQIIIFLFITPGTPRIVIVSYSMNYGVQNCVWTAFGDITANFIQATLVIFVLGTFFSDNPSFLNFFKWIGVAYLFYLAYDVYKSSPKDINSKTITSKSFFSYFFKSDPVSPGCPDDPIWIFNFWLWVFDPGDWPVTFFFHKSFIFEKNR